MQTRSKFFDDISQLMTNAAGVAQGARTEAETAMRGWFERFLAESSMVTREEFDAVREMALKAREENDRLSRRIDELEGRQAGQQAGEASTSSREGGLP
ncbi:MAG TPA: accessory factor UbiK family protein [Paracoccaceae bacterium]|nr:accessory factor UbiK family protein [Paracoccaceae bacterium]